jgi:ribosomal-protein-alanine N-acetyltransferase
VSSSAARRDLLYRPAGSGDVAAIAALEQASFASEAAATVGDGSAAVRGAATFGRPWGEADLAAALSPPGALALLAVAPDGAAGYALFHRVLDEAELLRVAVDPSQRGRGVGRQLLERGAHLLRAAGCSALFLEVHERNAPALALYRATGWQPAGRRPAYYPDGAAALVLRRTL